MLTNSNNQLAIGSQPPLFKLTDTVSQKTIDLAEFKQDAAVLAVMFICNHCPYVKHIEHHLAQLTASYIKKGVKFIAISANDAVNYPEDGPDKMRQRALDRGYKFPYLYDETQAVAKAYKAACTPEFYVFTPTHGLTYNGRYDQSTPNSGLALSGEDFKAALEASLAQNLPITNQPPALGCSIKWR